MIKIEVKEGKLPWFIGSGTIAAGVIIGILSVVYAKNPVYVKNSFPVAAAIIFAGAAMCLCAKNRGITVQDEQLYYKDCLGRKKTFALSDIGYCSAALESGSSRDYLKLYDISGAKLCKLEFNMKNADIFLQYLIDNGIKIECSQNSDLYLKRMAGARSITQKEAVSAAKDAYGKTKELIEEWVKRNKSFGAQWKFGLAFYIEEKFVQGKQLWEQEGAPAGVSDDLWENITAGLSGSSADDRGVILPGSSEEDREVILSDSSEEDREVILSGSSADDRGVILSGSSADDRGVILSGSHADDREVMLPEGLFIVIEGYLQKDGKFVIDRKNQAVSVSAKLMQVSKSLSMGEGLKIYFFGDAVEYISEQLLYYEQILPKRRYHMGELGLGHELYLEK